MRAAWWWIDRWRNSTAYTDMTAEEQGLYRNLLDEVWKRESHHIPDDQATLAKISGDPEAWKRSGERVMRWMRKDPEGWTNDTALEVIQQSKDRAEKQARYRNKRGNAAGNKAVVVTASPVSSLLSQSPVSGADRQKQQAPANPLVTGRRPALESECLKLVADLSKLRGEDPVDTLGKASHYEGAKRAAINPATMSDDRLANTVRDLRKAVAEAAGLFLTDFAEKGRELAEFKRRGAENLAKLKERL